MALTVRSPPTPELRCPELVDKGLTCAVDGHDEMLTVRGLPGEGHEITPTRRLGDVEAEVTSRMLDEPGPRRPLNTLHPLSEADRKGWCGKK